MLNDPLVINYAQTPTGFTGGIASNFRRTAEGYVSVDGAFSLDTPATLRIMPKRRDNGVSSYEVKGSIAKNVAAIAGVPQSDDILRFSLRLTGNNRSFTAADYINVVRVVYDLMIVNGARIVSGES